MDHQMKLIALMNWVAMKNPPKHELAPVVANIAGLIARAECEDAGEDVADRPDVADLLDEQARNGFHAGDDLLERAR